MMFKGMNRSGEGVSTAGVVIGLLLAAAILVFGFILLTDGFGLFGEVTDISSQLQTFAVKCAGYGQADTLASVEFCRYRLVEIGNKDQLLNCRDSRIKSILDENGINQNSGLLKCDDPSYPELIASACSDLSDRQKDNVIIAGDAGRTCNNPGTTAPYAVTTTPGTTPTIPTVALSSCDSSGIVVNTASCICGKTTTTSTADDKTCVANQYCKIASTGIGICSANPITA